VTETALVAFGAAGIAYFSALYTWRRQERRSVYASFVRAAHESLSVWESLTLNADPSADLRRDPLYEVLSEARGNTDLAWTEVRLVGSRRCAGLAEGVAASVASVVLDTGRPVTLRYLEEQERHSDTRLPEWQLLHDFVSEARIDLHVETRVGSWVRDREVRRERRRRMHPARILGLDEMDLDD
jgi:hypothetical protein